MMDKKITDGIDPCPFCGSTNFVVLSSNEQGSIHCSCGVTMECRTAPEFYEHIEGDLYRRIPKKYGLALAKEKWNRRITYNG